MTARRDLYAALMAGGPHSPERSEKASALIDAFKAEELWDLQRAGLSHATRAESVPTLLATIKELRGLRQPLIEALRTVHQSMTSCVGDEWAMEWLGEVWSQLPLGVRALAGDQDATAEIAAEQGALPVPNRQGGVQ